MVGGLAWRVLAGSSGFLTRVVVVPGAFYRSGADAFPALGNEQRGDPGEVTGQGVSPVRRRECPPSRTRFGG